MIWVKVDVSLRDHPRLLSIPIGFRSEALGTWLSALLYTRDQLLDGFCPLSALEGWGRPEVVDALVRVGLFSRATHPEHGDGVEVLKYAKHNQTRSAVDRRLKSDRVRKKTASRSSRIPSGLQPDSLRSPPPSGGGIPSLTLSLQKRDPERERDPDRDGDPDREAAQPRQTKAQQKSRIPDREHEVEWAKSYGIPPEHGEFPKFVDHFRSSGEGKVDWAATWRNWVRRAPEFAPRVRAGGPFGGPVQARLIPEDEVELARRKRDADEEFRRQELARLEARKRGNQQQGPDHE